MDRAIAEQVLTIQAAIQADPVYFVDEFTHQTPEDYQAAVMRSVFINPITSVRSCHDVGKSWISAKCALAFLSAYEDSYVITTAPTFRQVENILWRDIRSTYNRSKRPIGGRIFQTPRLDLGEEWFALGVSTKDPDMFQGFHAPSGHILVIVDEAAGVTEDIFIAIDSVLSSEGARLLMIGNPTAITGRFYQSHHSDPTAKRFHLSCFDTPNFKNNGIRTLQDLQDVDLETVEITHPYLITPAWAKDKIRKWGIESPMFQARVLGNFPTAEANTLIPLNLIEAAATPERLEELEAAQEKDPSLRQRFISADPARYGNDKTAITEREGGIVEPQTINGKEDTTQTAGRIKLLKPAAGVFVDADGVGAGVVDILIDDLVENVIEIHGSAAPFPDDTGLTFINLRAQIYWHLMLRFKEGTIYIPEDEELMSQLASIRFFVTRRGIKIEDKDDIIKRLKISPDQADSLAYCFADFMTVPEDVLPSLGKSTDELYNERMDR